MKLVVQIDRLIRVFVKMAMGSPLSVAVGRRRRGSLSSK